MIEPIMMDIVASGNPFDGVSPDFGLWGGAFTETWQRLLAGLWGAALVVTAFLAIRALVMMSNTKDDNPAQYQQSKTSAVRTAAAIVGLLLLGVIYTGIYALTGV